MLNKNELMKKMNASINISSITTSIQALLTSFDEIIDKIKNIEYESRILAHDNYSDV